MKKVLFVILDGVSDGLREKTSLEAANKQYLDFFASRGYAGLVENRLGAHPDSGISIFTLLGYLQEDYPGRGYLDALGMGLNLKPTDVCIRANFATVEQSVADRFKTGQFEPELVVIDRRAGRDPTGLTEMAQQLSLTIDGMKINFYKSVAHRAALIISNIEVSPDVSDNDPGKEGLPPQEIKPLTNDNNAVRTASVLNEFERQSYRILKNHPANKARAVPANYILLRGAGRYKHIRSFKETFGLKGACIAASPVVRGIAKALDMKVIDVPGATADLKTNLSGKTLAALDALRTNDFVILHILGCDIAGHDKSLLRKQMFIEKIDREVFSRISEYADFKNTLLIVTSDHVTSVFSGEHEAGFLPFLFFGKGMKPNEVQKFDEKSCRAGPLIDITDFMEKLLEAIQ